MKIDDYGPGILIDNKNFTWPQQQYEYAVFVKNFSDSSEHYVCATMHGYILEGTISICIKGKVAKNIRFPHIFVRNSFKNMKMNDCGLSILI